MHKQVLRPGTNRCKRVPSGSHAPWCMSKRGMEDLHCKCRLRGQRQKHSTGYIYDRGKNYRALLNFDRFWLDISLLENTDFSAPCYMERHISTSTCSTSANVNEFASSPAHTVGGCFPAGMAYPIGASTCLPPGRAYLYKPLAAGPPYK